MGIPVMRRSKHARQGVFSHQGLRKASAADPVNTGLAGSTGMAAKLLPFWYQSVCHTTRASKSEIFLIVETRILFRIQIKWHGQ
jgi:hypothetical protein